MVIPVIDIDLLEYLLPFSGCLESHFTFCLPHNELRDINVGKVLLCFCP